MSVSRWKHKKARKFYGSIKKHLGKPVFVEKHLLYGKYIRGEIEKHSILRLKMGEMKRRNRRKYTLFPLL